ncbi:MAG: hypothetical protein A3F89_07675 [Deltaproteobacteria bacterium RIFCSPLOWO2_12_FULL_50_11]|nr:MAG: hypothetical protein A3F89_07675 [Deltaproteobacteria bacterium RIFCSPLOWO2_12_FULL_50_11]
MTRTVPLTVSLLPCTGTIVAVVGIGGKVSAVDGGLIAVIGITTAVGMANSRTAIIVTILGLSALSFDLGAVRRRGITAGLGMAGTVESAIFLTVPGHRTVIAPVGILGKDVAVGPTTIPPFTADIRMADTIASAKWRVSLCRFVTAGPDRGITDVARADYTTNRLLGPQLTVDLAGRIIEVILAKLSAGLRGILHRQAGVLFLSLQPRDPTHP